MATRTKSRAKKTKAAPRDPSPLAVTSRAAVGGLGRGAIRVARWLGRIETPERVRSEVVGLTAISMAVLIALPMVGLATSQSLLGGLGGALMALLGRGALLVPIGLLGAALESFVPSTTGARQRRALGYALLSVAVLMFLSVSQQGGRPGGGMLGAGLSAVSRAVAGTVGAGIIAFTLGLVGVYLLTGADAVSVVRAWRRARAAQQAARRARASAAPAAEVKRPRPGPAPTQSARPPARPVINVPKPDRGTGTPTERQSPPLPASDGSAIVLQPVALPDLTRLALYDGATPDSGELEHKASLIQETLANFRVDATVREVYPGPAVTLFTLEPGPGVKVRRITELQNDLALALAAPSIRIEAPVPGMARVGIELPNSSVLTVGLRETIDSSAFQRSKAKIPLSLGRDVNGSYVIGDLTKMPHLLIAGATGSGKSVCINGIIATFLLTRRPHELQMVLIDPKMVELVGFNGVPHLKCPVVTEMDKVVGTLRLVLQEMEQRYQRFSALGVRNIDGYNLRRDDDPSLEAMPFLVVIIDELADLMMTTPEEVETLLVRLAQMARATGIHLLIATQRPSVDVLTGLIKANVPARIAFAVTSQTDSRVILDLPGAERLLGRGDMLFLPPDAAKPHRVQGSFIDDRDLQYLVRHWKKVVPNHQYDPAWSVEPGSEGGGADDPLMEQALQVVRQHGSASASMLQRRLRIGYNRASRLIEQMEEEGYVGPADGSRGRPVYVADDE
ncbi:MAG TPA: DNA translocase FtsK 4TM domain-containing protein [Thermomicrobiaceae bacterium]|nr:DNA translocase FtsK 4TM domain-containing protein [Thermomicrobiaceae bacterium]